MNTEAQIGHISKGELSKARIIYILFGLGFIFPLLAGAGLVYAYASKGKSMELDSHLRFQIRTFWIGLLLMIVGGVTIFFLIGYAILLLWFVWAVIRVLSGFMAAGRGVPISHPTTLGFTV